MTDLLVTCAVLLLLVAIMGPTLGRARQSGRNTVCESILGQFGVGLAAYAIDNENWIPGVNTSGVAIRAKKWLPPDDPNGFQQSNLAVQSFDFMSPLLPYISDAELPANRAARWNNLWTEYRCPAQKYDNDFIYNPAYVPDFPDFAPYVSDWFAASYLMPTQFSLWGNSHNHEVIGMYEGPRPVTMEAQTISASSSVLTGDYVSRLDQVGPADRKIFAADGTRYLSGDGLIDIDISIEPAYFGSFTSAGAWWPGANAYGVLAGSLNWDRDPVPFGNEPGGANLPISYRHRGDATPQVAPTEAIGGDPTDIRGNRGEINAVFFDGHVLRMNDRQSRAIDMWHPSGSIVQDPIGMTSVKLGYEIP